MPRKQEYVSHEFTLQLPYYSFMYNDNIKPSCFLHCPCSCVVYTNLELEPWHMALGHLLPGHKEKQQIFMSVNRPVLHFPPLFPSYFLGFFFLGHIIFFFVRQSTADRRQEMKGERERQGPTCNKDPQLDEGTLWFIVSHVKPWTLVTASCIHKEMTHE